MQKRRLTLVLTLFCLILLAGCSSKNDSAKNNEDNHTVSSKSIKTQKTSDSSSSVTKGSTSVSNFWNNYKSQKLNQFMNTWSKTMGQSYTEYGLGNNLNYFVSAKKAIK